MAEANMTMISRAEITSINTPATERKALVLDGTTIELGDTGLRDLSGFFISGRVQSGRVLVKRVGSTVTWYLKDLRIATGASHPWEIIGPSDLLARFAPESTIFQAVMSNGTDTARLLVETTGSVAIHYGEPSHTYSAAVTFNTSRPWPAILPGVADGQPVGV